MMQAMIFAAGLGTRLKPVTDTMPKALVPVGGKPLIGHVIGRLKEAGTDKIVVNVHHFASQIIDFLRTNDNFGVDISISDESDKLLDTGGGIKAAARLFDHGRPVLVHNVDIMSNADLKRLYGSHAGAEVTLLVSERITKRYLLFDDAMRLVGWTNIETGEVKTPYKELDVAACHRYAFSGIHVISPDVFRYMDDFPDKFGIIDFYLKVCDKIEIKARLQEGLRLLDVGKADTLAEAEALFSRMRRQ